MAYAGKELLSAQHMTNEAVTNAYRISAPSVTYSASISASTDPFAGKTNKYAESNIVRLISTVGYHVRFGTVAGVGTAVTTDYFVAANVAAYFVVDTNNPAMRIIPTTGTASYFVTEIY